MAAVASSGGCCTLVVDEEIPPFLVKGFEYLEKCYINVTHYYYKNNIDSLSVPQGQSVTSQLGLSLKSPAFQKFTDLI